MTKREKELLRRLWEDETDPEWREDLTEEEAQYLRQLDEQFFSAVANLAQRILDAEKRRTEKGD